MRSTSCSAAAEVAPGCQDRCRRATSGCVTRISFAELFERLRAVGLTVAVELDGARHVICVADRASDRTIRYPVEDTRFDAAAATLVLSARLRERLGAPAGSAPADPRRPSVVGRWPEFEALWPSAPCSGPVG